MMKRRFLSVLLSLLAAGFAFGDKVVLNDGTEIEGKVVAELDDSYEVEVMVTDTIKDVKIIKKSDVKSVVLTSPEDLAFKEIEALLPTPDRLSASDYERIVNKQVKAFTDAFPKTKHRKRVEGILTILARERDLAKAGGLKLDGKWIKPDDREANAYEIDARILSDDIAKAAKEKKYKEALREFEKFEADFSASAPYQKTVETIKGVLAAYRPVVMHGIKRVDEITATRKTELERLPAGQRSAALAEVKRRSELYAKVIAQEKSRRTKWFTLEQFHKAPMEETLSNIQNEMKRLTAINFEEVKMAGSAYRDAWAAAAAGDKTLATQRFGELKSLRVPDRYVEILEARLAKQTEAGDAPETTVTDTTTPDAGTTPDSGTASSPDDEEPADAADESGDAGTSSTGDSEIEPLPVEDEEEGGLNMKSILMIVIAVVLIIAVVAMLSGGKKKK